MSSPQLTVFLVAATSLALGGFVSNGFIVGVITIEWAKFRSLASIEQLLLSLGMSNLCYTVVLTVFSFGENILSIFNRNPLFPVLYFFFSFVTLCRFWLTAWLCVFYCVKIVNNTHSLIIWCKLRISWLLSLLLVASVAISLITSNFSVFGFHFSEKSPIQSRINTTANITNMAQEECEIKPVNSYKIFFFVTGISCPFLVVLLCSILIVASLFKHVCKIAGEEFSLRSSQTEAHFKAAGTVLFLLFLYLSVYVAQVVVMTADVQKTSATVSLCITVMMIYSPAQAAVLILVNPKFKQIAAKIYPGCKKTKRQQFEQHRI